MGAVSAVLLPALPLPLLRLRPQQQQQQQQQQQRPPPPRPGTSHSMVRALLLPGRLARRGSSSQRCRGVNGEKTVEEASQFFDEDGVVKDMDGYLNYLSLEYDSVWDTKPSWCQPWTILLTGTTAIACSWIFLRSLLISAAVSTVVGGWWYIFLYSYPKAYSDMIAERRRKVTSGIEDTFGDERNE